MLSYKPKKEQNRVPLTKKGKEKVKKKGGLCQPRLGDQHDQEGTSLSLCPDVSAGAMPCGRRPDAKQRKKESEGGGKWGRENKRRLREQDRVKNG